jgi:hypothetical protein
MIDRKQRTIDGEPMAHAYAAACGCLAPGAAAAAEDYFYADVLDCAACGRVHRHVLFRPFEAAPPWARVYSGSCITSRRTIYAEPLTGAVDSLPRAVVHPSRLDVRVGTLEILAQAPSPMLPLAAMDARVSIDGQEIAVKRLVLTVEAGCLVVASIDFTPTTPRPPGDAPIETAAAPSATGGRG